jgi:hypothetical protein
MSSIRKNIKIRLCKLSGEDYSIISECSNKIQNYYSMLGFLVLLILFFSFASALYFTEQLFHSIIADIGVGLVWGYIVTNMYVLLLYTISPALLPVKVRQKQAIKTKQFELSFSMILRLLVVILLALIIAQPLNVLILKPDSTTLAYDIKYLLSTNPLATFISLLVIAIFLLPIYLKYSIRNFGKFYEKKAEIEKRIIEDDYREFKKKYSILLESNIIKYNKSVWENLIPFLSKLEQVNPLIYKKHFDEIKNDYKIYSSLRTFQYYSWFITKTVFTDDSYKYKITVIFYNIN